jgi:ADP-heptose:LPS heptosyltransferase
MAGIPQRVGYYTPKRGFLLTQKIMPVCRDSLHRIDYYLNIIEKAGLRVEDRFSEFFIKDEDEDFIEGFLADKGIAPGDFLIGLNPGGNWMPKRWPKEYWARLADMLIGRLHAKVIVTGALTDAGLAREIQELMEGKAILACGLFNLKQFATLTKILDLFISADSGPLHIANAVGCKNIIALYGPTSTRVTAPYPLKNVVILRRDSGCITPCYKVDCPDNRCMKAITPEEVFKEAEKIRGER